MTVLLFVPADRPERFAKATGSGANFAIVDLEDAVAAPNRPRGREALQAALEGGLDAIVRINSPRSDDGRADLAALAGYAPRAIAVPKVEAPNEVSTNCVHAPAIALIESTRGMRAIDAIAAEPNVIALAFGAFDLCAELGAQPVPEVLAPLRSAIVVAARLAGKAAIDAPFVGIDDDSELEADARRALAFGFDGKLAIHPKHVATIRRVFEPSESELQKARRIVKAAEAGGVAVVDGMMIDAPLVASARRVAARVAS